MSLLSKKKEENYSAFSLYITSLLLLGKNCVTTHHESASVKEPEHLNTTIEFPGNCTPRHKQKQGKILRKSARDVECATYLCGQGWRWDDSKSVGGRQ